VYKQKVIEKQKMLLKKGIIEHGSLTALGEYLGKPKQNLNRWLQGQREMKWSIYLELSEKLNMNK
jgi:hypothetical protein